MHHESVDEVVSCPAARKVRTWCASSWSVKSLDFTRSDKMSLRVSSIFGLANSALRSRDML